MDAAALAPLADRRDKLLPKLYKRRLELDFRNPPLDARRGAGLSKICCCRWCGKLFHFAASPILVGDRGPLLLLLLLLLLPCFYRLLGGFCAHAHR